MTKLNELPSTTETNDEDIVLIQQGGSDKQVLKSDLMTADSASGEGQTVGAALDDRVINVLNVAALRTVEPLVAKQQVELNGHTIAGLGGGIFWYDDTDTTTTDNNATVIVTAGGKRWKRKYKVLDVYMFGALGGGNDDTTALQAFLDFLTAGAEAALPPDSFGHSSTLMWITEYVQVRAFGAELKALAAMDGQITAGKTGRTEYQEISGLHFNGGGFARYGVHDIGTRFFALSKCTSEQLLDGTFYQAPTSTAFSEFAEASHCFQEDGKWFHKSVATSSAHVTDTVLRECVVFRPTEWFAVWQDCERMHAENCMAGSQVNAFNGGILIETVGTATGAPSNGTVECRIDDFYLETNGTYGTGMYVTVVRNPNTGEKSQGHLIQNPRSVPVNQVGLLSIEAPGTAGNTRQITIKGRNSLGGFSDAIKIGSGAAFTRITADLADSTLLSYINDSGINTIINGITSQAAGAGNAPSNGAVGDIMRNSNDDTLWVIDSSGTARRIGGGELYGSTTQDAPSIASGSSYTFGITVTGAGLGDSSIVSAGISLAGLTLTSYVSGADTVTVVLANLTGGAVDLGNTTYRATVTKLKA